MTTLAPEILGFIFALAVLTAIIFAGAAITGAVAAPRVEACRAIAMTYDARLDACVARAPIRPWERQP